MDHHYYIYHEKKIYVVLTIHKENIEVINLETNIKELLPRNNNYKVINVNSPDDLRNIYINYCYKK